MEDFANCCLYDLSQRRRSLLEKSNFKDDDFVNGVTNDVKVEPLIVVRELFLAPVQMKLHIRHICIRTYYQHNENVTVIFAIVNCVYCCVLSK